MKFFKTFTFLSSLFLTLFFLPTFTKGAELVNPENHLSLITQPAFPAPETQVDAKVESFLFDLNRSKISWYINGILKRSNLAETEFSFVLGKIGTATEVKVIIETAEGVQIEQIKSIRPARVDLAWEADSTVPPFYKGKALFPPQGRVKMVALPSLVDGNGGMISSSNLVYKWTIDREIKGSLSGYGKDTYSFEGSILSRPVRIKVEVSSLTNNQTAMEETILTPTEPETLLYEDNPIFGVTYESTLPSNFSLNQPEIKIVGRPFFFSKQNLLSSIWSMNGNRIESGDDDKSVTLRQDKGVSGLANINLSIKNNNKLLQEAGTGSVILFGQ